MTPLRRIAVALIGVSFVAIGVVLGIGGSGDRSVGPGLAVALIVFVAFAVALRNVWGALDSNGDAPVPWSADEPFADPAPERIDPDLPLSADDLATGIEAAGATARTGGTVEDGFAVVRPALREALLDALVRGGRSRADAERTIADGTWTDDALAASLLEPKLAGPERSLRERLSAWLFPERVVRERIARTMGAIAEAANEAVPTVPGQTAPRTVPVLQPRLGELTRGTDGRLRRAVDPRAAARGPRPRRARLEDGDGRDGDAPAEFDDSIDDDTALGDGSAFGDDVARSDAADREGAGSGDWAAEPGSTDRGADGSVPDGSDANRSRSDADESDPAASTEDDLRTRVDGRRRWRGAVAAAVVLVAVAVVDGSGVLLLGAAVPLAYVVYGALSGAPTADALAARRTVSPNPAPPGRPVRVALEVTNEGDRTLPDVRLADGVPEELAVVEGSPRAGTTLEPGESVTVAYLLVARRGEYAFEPPDVRVRGLGAAATATTGLRADGDQSLSCRLDANPPPLERDGFERLGQLTTDRPGDGVAFHSTREYRPDDPADRIDWRHYAKRKSLATVSYEREAATSVVLVVDAREPNRVVAGPGRPSAVELSAYAATRALIALLERGHDVGVAVVGLEGCGPTGVRWLEPGSGGRHRSRALEILREATERDATDRTDDERIRDVVERAPVDAQFAMFSPFLDAFPVRAVETWRGAGLSVAAVSPDVVPSNTVSGQHARTRRRTRLARCQAAGVRVVDWRRGTPLPLVVEYAFAAESRLADPGVTGAGGGGGRGTGTTDRESGSRPSTASTDPWESTAGAWAPPTNPRDSSENSRPPGGDT